MWKRGEATIFRTIGKSKPNIWDFSALLLPKSSSQEGKLKCL